MNASIAEAPAQVGKIQNASALGLGPVVNDRGMPVARSGQLRKAAGASLADVNDFDHLACGVAPGPRG